MSDGQQQNDGQITGFLGGGGVQGNK